MEVVFSILNMKKGDMEWENWDIEANKIEVCILIYYYHSVHYAIIVFYVDDRRAHSIFLERFRSAIVGKYLIGPIIMLSIIYID